MRAKDAKIGKQNERIEALESILEEHSGSIEVLKDVTGVNPGEITLEIAKSWMFMLLLGGLISPILKQLGVMNIIDRGFYYLGCVVCSFSIICMLAIAFLYVSNSFSRREINRENEGKDVRRFLGISYWADSVVGFLGDHFGGHFRWHFLQDCVVFQLSY